MSLLRLEDKAIPWKDQETTWRKQRRSRNRCSHYNLTPGYDIQKLHVPVRQWPKSSTWRSRRKIVGMICRICVSTLRACGSQYGEETCVCSTYRNIWWKSTQHKLKMVFRFSGVQILVCCYNTKKKKDCWIGASYRSCRYFGTKPCLRWA